MIHQDLHHASLLSEARNHAANYLMIIFDSNQLALCTQANFSAESNNISSVGVPALRNLNGKIE